MYDREDQRAGEAKRPHGSGIMRQFADEARFVKTLFENPRLTGAVSPSGRFLARTMARSVDPLQPGLVVELGPGTGPVTKALIERGVPVEDMVLLEHDAKFCGLLTQRFPGVRVIQGDAYRLRETLAELLSRPIKAVVSSLPLLNESTARRAELLADAFTIMGAAGVFIQFTYGLVAPAPRRIGALRLTASPSARVWLNLPPARVWTYRFAAIDTAGQTAATLAERQDKFGAGAGARFAIEEAHRGKTLALLRDRLTRH